MEIPLVNNTINLTDNNRGSKTPVEQFNRYAVAALFPFSGKSIETLCAENEHLLVFPHCLCETKDNLKKSSIFSVKNTDNPDYVTIETGNIMGFIGVGNLKVNIKSRFSCDGKDYFLHYMLQKVMHYNLIDMKHNNDDEEVLDFLMFMFPYFLKRAVQQGVYREYHQYKHNDSNVKGTISIAHQIQKNIPFSGKIAYTTKEYSYDNRITQLIRHTIEYIYTKDRGKSVLKMDSDTINCVEMIKAQTPSYNKLQRSSVVQQNLRPKVHPYYTAYLPLCLLCLQILHNEEMKYGDQHEEIYGILFDGAWLWEEYVNTILQDMGFTHAENKTGKNPIYLFRDDVKEKHFHNTGRRYPDFYKKGEVVLDAKYKWLEKCDTVSAVARDDIHQLITYMYALNAGVGGFVAPLTQKQETLITSHLTNHPASTLSILGIEISTAASWEDFEEQMGQNEQDFTQVISTHMMKGVHVQ